MAQRFLGDRAVHHRQELRQCFQDHHLGPQARPHAAQFDTDHPGADHAQALRHLGEVQRAPGVHDLLAVEGRDLQVDRLGAGGDHDVLGTEDLGLSLVRLVLDLAVAQQLAGAEQAGDLVGREQLLDAAGEAPGNRGLARLHLGQVQRDTGEIHAVVGELMLGAMIDLGGFQQRLGGDAARVEAGATEGRGVVAIQPGVDASGLEPQLRGADRAGITGGAAANDNDVVLLFAHEMGSSLIRRILAAIRPRRHPRAARFSRCNAAPPTRVGGADACFRQLPPRPRQRSRRRRFHESAASSVGRRSCRHASRDGSPG